MRLRMVVPALMIGAGLLLTLQVPAQAKVSYQQHKIKKYTVSRKFKNKNYKNKRFKAPKPGKHSVIRHY